MFFELRIYEHYHKGMSFFVWADYTLLHVLNHALLSSNNGMEENRCLGQIESCNIN